MATILKHLQQWQSNQTRQSQIIDDTIDPSIYKSISDYVASRVQKAIASTTSQLAELQEEANMIISENERQSIEIDAKDEELAVLLERYAELAGRVIFRREVAISFSA